jgi:hypothetical protein
MLPPHKRLERLVRHLRILEERKSCPCARGPPRDHLHMGAQIRSKRPGQVLPGSAFRDLVEEQLGQLALIHLKSKISRQQQLEKPALIHLKSKISRQQQLEQPALIHLKSKISRQQQLEQPALVHLKCKISCQQQLEQPAPVLLKCKITCQQKASPAHCFRVTV